MAFTWIAGDLDNIPIEWLHLEAVCEVSREAELLTVKLSGLTEDLEGYFDNFALFKNLLEDKLTGNEVVYLPVDETADEFEIPIFGAVVEVAQIMAAHIIPKEDIIGSDTDPIILKLISKETGDTICTKTFLAGTDALAFEVTDFGPVNENNNEINYGKGVSLAKEGAAALPPSLIVVEWNLG